MSVFRVALFAARWFRGTHEFIVDFYAPEDQANSRRIEQVVPFFHVCLVDVSANVACPVYPGGFGVSDVGDIIDVAWIGHASEKKHRNSIDPVIEWIDIP